VANLEGDALVGWQRLLARAGISPAPGEPIVVKLDTGAQVQVTDTKVEPVSE
jgi:hypothetical protein